MTHHEYMSVAWIFNVHQPLHKENTSAKTIMINLLLVSAIMFYCTDLWDMKLQFSILGNL